MNLENIREGELKEIFDILENAFKENNIDFYLIGAIARDIWYTMGSEEFRSTKDIDFAVLIGNRQDYQRVRDYLTKNGFTESSTNAFVIIAPSGLQIDLLPFGEMEIDEEVSFEGRGLTSIKVNGFMEVYFFTSIINPVSIGVAAGLVVGKFIGVLSFTWLMVKFGFGKLPDQATWNQMTGVALLAGIGFTMSLFISGLAFKNPIFVEQAKYGILIASVLAGILGTLVLRRSSK